MGRAAEPEVGIVTGAAGGVGRETVLKLQARGAAIVAADLNESGLAETAEAAQQAYPSAEKVVCKRVDVSDDAEVRSLVATALETFGRVDKVANVAGYAIRESFGETTLEDWRQMIDINLTSVFSLCQEAAKSMPHGGSMVNVSSVGSFMGMGYSAYNAAKGGIIGLTKMIATELARSGIRVNTVAPGPIATACRRRCGRTPMSSLRWPAPRS